MADDRTHDEVSADSASVDSGQVRRAPQLIAVALGTVALACGALAIVFFVMGPQSSSTALASGGLNVNSSQAQSVLALSRQGAVNFLSFDYRHQKSDYARFAGMLTPSFKKLYTYDTGQIAALFVEKHVVSSAQVVDSALTSLTASNATTLVSVNVTTTTSSAPKGTTSYDRIAVQLVRKNGKWLISKVNLI